MRRLKVVFLILCTCIFALYPQAVSLVCADEIDYLRIISDDVILYGDKNFTEPICFLPYTYYLIAVNEEENGFFVECDAGEISIDGFVKADEVFSDGQEVDKPYPNLLLKTNDICVLYSDFNLENKIQFVYANRDLQYFGEYVNDNGKHVFLVSYGDKLGYVEEDFIVPFTLSHHPNALTFLPDETPSIPTVNQTKSDDDLVIKIVVIACLFGAGIIALFISLKPKKLPLKNADFDTENEQE